MSLFFWVSEHVNVFMYECVHMFEACSRIGTVFSRRHLLVQQLLKGVWVREHLHTTFPLTA